jgi:cytoskeletal protein CcmA (bactofilin family)
VRIEGTVRGDVLVGGTAELAEGGTIEGNVQAEGVDVSGSLQGDVSARGPIAIHGSAVVRGELKGSEVSIEPGARVSVRVQTDFELDLGNPRRR